MAAIDIGSEASDRAATTNCANYTCIDYNNASNEIGLLTSVELWCDSNANSVKIGTFDEVGANTFTNRDYTSVGNVTSGSKQTFSGLSIDVSSGDYIGVVSTSGTIDHSTSGGSGKYRIVGDQFGQSNVNFGSIVASQTLSLYGIGISTTIDIGPGATDRNDAIATASRTYLSSNNPSNDIGIITSIELYFVNTYDGADVKVGTLYGSSTSWTSRDSHTIGSVTSGSKQTFSGLSISVETNDIIGCYFTGGRLEYSNPGTGNVYYKAGDQFGSGTQTYTEITSRDTSLYGTGTTEVATGWTGKIWGVTNPAKIWGIPVANISKVGGI